MKYAAAASCLLLTACAPQALAPRYFNEPAASAVPSAPPALSESQELAGAVQECAALYGTKLEAPAAKCRGDKFLAIHTRHHPKAADADLLALFIARTVEIDDRFDHHKITKAQRDVEIAQANAQFNESYDARVRRFEAEENAYQARVENEATFAEAQRRAQRDAAWDSLISAGAQMMQQSQPTVAPTRIYDCGYTPGSLRRSVTCE